MLGQHLPPALQKVPNSSQLWVGMCRFQKDPFASMITGKDSSLLLSPMTLCHVFTES